MSLFQDFHPIIRFVSDFERASRTPSRCSPHKPARTFQPKFDVKELEDSYVLQGELPGIDQKDISIEWADASTIAIKGHTEHRVVKKSQPAAAPAPTPAAEAETEVKETKEAEYQKPSVEEEEAEHSDDFVEVESHSQDTASTSTAQPTEEAAAPKASEEAAKSARYWISERSVGTFHRAFSFPVRVENEAVTASLKNGILSVVVPKAKIPEPRRINIE
jgi:HSP20 family protein